MNNFCDEEWFSYKNIFNQQAEHEWISTENRVNFPNGKDWKEYIDSKRLEITCGEAPYSYSIKNVAQVFTRLLDFEYKQKEILNFDLVDYVLSEKMNTESAKMLIEQLSNHTEESMSFIKSYVERRENIDKLLYYLCKKNNLLWKDITEDDGIPLETRYKYLVLLLKYADIDDVVAQDKVLDGDDGILGILLCKEKDDALVEITLPDDANIYASEYQLYLPDKKELQKKLKEWIEEGTDL